MCYTLGGLPIYSILITGNAGGRGSFDKKKYVVITSRVHASETPGSYKAQAMLSLLTSSDPAIEFLRGSLVFLVLPMLNPDGVVLGNNRCSAKGHDLNRCWNSPSCSQPAIWHLKNKLSQLAGSGKEILMYCDLHGHSKLMNSFVYACHAVTAGDVSSWTRVRLLPRILARNCHLFDYHQCSFKVESEKMNTARVIVWKEFKVINSFTLETSVYGYTLGKDVVRFSERDYFRIGEAFVKALHEYIVLLEQVQTDSCDNVCRQLKVLGMPAADQLRMEVFESEKKGKDKLRVRLAVGRVGKRRNEKSSITEKLPSYKVSQGNCFGSQGATRSKTASGGGQEGALGLLGKAEQKTLWGKYFSEAELAELATDTVQCLTNTERKTFDYSNLEANTQLNKNSSFVELQDKVKEQVPPSISRARCSNTVKNSSPDPKADLSSNPRLAAARAKQGNAVARKSERASSSQDRMRGYSASGRFFGCRRAQQSVRAQHESCACPLQRYSRSILWSERSQP